MKDSQRPDHVSLANMVFFPELVTQELVLQTGLCNLGGHQCAGMVGTGRRQGRGGNMDSDRL